MFLTAHVFKAFRLRCLLVLIMGTTRWGRKIKKNPDNNKNNADRQRFQGGLVNTSSPFDYWPRQNLSGPLQNTFGPGLFQRIPAKHVQFLRKPLKSPFLRFANTDFHA
jgi:hypothetical protein